MIDAGSLSSSQARELVARLTADCPQRRFLSKAPSNSFRIDALRGLFPDARIVAIYRRGEEVVASRGRRSYGFGREVRWGEMQVPRLSYLRGIRTFVRKWRETLEYVEEQRKKEDFCVITYEQLRCDTRRTLGRVFEHIELAEEPYLDDVRLKSGPGSWKAALPLPYRILLRAWVIGGNRVIARIEEQAPPGGTAP